ncbi:MAG: hypothetical protein ACRERD_23290 [Candidatus Binatia bacterium]
MRHLHYRLTVFLPIVLYGCVHTPSETSQFTVSVRKPNDTVQILSENEQFVLLITCKSGIGSATITLRQGAWPARAVVRLRYAPGRPFQYLESFTVRTGSSETVSIEEHRVENEYREVDLPSRLLDTNPQRLELEWIDAYR